MNQKQLQRKAKGAASIHVNMRINARHADFFVPCDTADNVTHFDYA